MTNIDVVEQVYKAYENYDFAGILELSDPDGIITQDPSLPWGGRFTGHDGVTEWAMALIGATESTLVVEALFEADDRVIEYGRSRGTVRSNGNSFDIPQVHVWTLRNGKIVEAHFALDTPAMLAALG